MSPLNFLSVGAVAAEIMSSGKQRVDMVVREGTNHVEGECCDVKMTMMMKMMMMMMLCECVQCLIVSRVGAMV
jgi:hypothetical protein